jgi:hypothetical protein
MAFALGALYDVFSTSIPAATRSKEEPYLRSLSRIRNRGPSPNGVASRSCCATHRSVGFLVTPKCTTRREPNSMITNTNIVRKKGSYV